MLQRAGTGLNGRAEGMGIVHASRTGAVVLPVKKAKTNFLLSACSNSFFFVPNTGGADSAFLSSQQFRGYSNPK